MGQILRRQFLTATGALLGAPLVRAQQAGKVYRVGWVNAITSVSEVTKGTYPLTKVLLRELGELGYVEGKNLVLDVVSAEGHQDRYADTVSEVLRRRPDVIMVSGSQLALIAKKATSVTPIVMIAVAQPVKYGLVASLARPGGNVTGLAADANPETEAKRLQLLKELVPKLSRVSCLATKWIWEGPYGQAVRKAAPALGVELLYAEHRPDDLKTTFASITGQHPDALFVVLAPEVYGLRQQIATFALNARLPAIYPLAEMAEAGGLMSYGWNLPEFYRVTARYIAKIFKGAKPGELPVQQPSVFELVVNLKTAKAIGLTIPQSILVRADRVLE